MMRKNARPLFVIVLFLLPLFLVPNSSRNTYTKDFGFYPQYSPTLSLPDTITVAAVGDIMLGSTYPLDRALPSEDGALILRDVAPLLSAADIAFGNLEGPMLEGGRTSKCSAKSRFCYAFRMPIRYGKHLKDAGFDLMSLANNHSSDFGPQGRESTIRVLDSLGIAHAGGDSQDLAHLDVRGRRVVMVAFATNAFSHNLNDIAAASRTVAQVAQEADIVIVSFHGGAEGPAALNVPRGPEIFLGEARGNLRAFTHAVVDAGADLVLGSGPHVVRGMEIYQGRLIAYSLGNFAFHGFGFRGPTGLSLILNVTLSPDGAFLAGRIHSIKQEGQNGPRIDNDREIIPILRDLSALDFGTTAPQISEDGTITAPL